MTAELAIARFASVARPLILEFFPPNSCVASTRIAIECLARFGVEAEAVAMKFVVEAKARNLAYITGLDPQERAYAERESGMFIDLQSPAGRKTWNGHVVAVAKGEHFRHLIDASFDQASMPDYGLHISPCVLVIPVETNIQAQDIHAKLELLTDQGETLRVQYIPLDDWSFYDEPAWETDHLQPLVERICEQMGERGRPTIEAVEAPPESRVILHAVDVALKSALAGLGCADPLIEIRLIDVDTAPEPGAYLDVTLSARIRIADYKTVLNEVTT